MSRRVLVDGMLSHLGEEPDLLDASELDAVVVTAADWHAGFTEACQSLARWWERVTEAPERWFVVQEPDDVDRVGGGDGIGLVLALQNGTLIEDRLERLWTLQRLGIRVIQPTYNTATLIADGCLEERDAGLSGFGRAFVRECNRLGIAIDLSHVGDRSALDIVEESGGPVVITHANRRSVAENPRNKPDALLRDVAAKGGVVGATAYGPACWRGGAEPPAFDDFAAQVESLLELVGEDAVAIGSDHYVGGPDDIEHLQRVLDRTAARYGGIVGPYVGRFGNGLRARYPEGFQSIDDWPSVPERLRERLGLDDAVLDKVLGGNLLRVLRAVMRGSAQYVG